MNKKEYIKHRLPGNKNARQNLTGILIVKYNQLFNADCSGFNPFMLRKYNNQLSVFKSGRYFGLIYRVRYLKSAKEMTCFLFFKNKPAV